MKFGSKRAIFGVIWGVLRGLDLVWESAIPPTHIWERSPKKKRFFLAASLTECWCTLCRTEELNYLQARKQPPHVQGGNELVQTASHLLEVSPVKKRHSKVADKILVTGDSNIVSLHLDILLVS